MKNVFVKFLTYGNVKNPLGLPHYWPAHVEEISEDDCVNLAPPWFYMSKEQYLEFVATLPAIDAKTLTSKKKLARVWQVIRGK